MRALFPSTSVRILTSTGAKRKMKKTGIVATNIRCEKMIVAFFCPSVDAKNGINTKYA